MPSFTTRAISQPPVEGTSRASLHRGGEDPEEGQPHAEAEVKRSRKRPDTPRSDPSARHTVSLPTGGPMPITLQTVVLLVLSNLFMTFAWYGHLKELGQRPWYLAAVVSWGIALFEYLLQVPANRIGYTVLTLPQLKILQEAITLAVFVPFAVLYMRQPVKLDYLWSALCVMGAVHFGFRR